MSHFTVLVSVPKNKTIEDVLQPFHEYECTGTNDQYVCFVEPDETDKELKDEYNENKNDYDCFEDFISDYYGYRFMDGKIGRLTNPNAKWDWWTVGGRWSGTLKNKSGIRCNEGLKSEIDFDAMKKENVERCLIDYEKIKSLTCDKPWISWVDCRENKELSNNDAREFYNNQPPISIIRKEFDNPFLDIDQFLRSRDEFIKDKEFEGISTFAILHDGNWIEKGDMGWWGCVSDEKNVTEWRDIYTEALNRIPDDNILYVVDCHI